MAFNPTTYEHIYGFELFDTVHNFFPEIMYDEELFTSDLENWIRYRISSFFPAMYSRQQNLYRIYRAQTLRDTYNNWLSGNVQNVVIPNFPSQPTQVRFSPPRSPTYSPRIVRNYNTQPSFGPRQRNQGRQEQETRTTVEEPSQNISQTPPIVRRVNRTIRTGTPESLLISILQNAELPSLATNLVYDELHRNWPRAFVDVNVPATAAQIAAASEIKENNQVPAETVCAICQDHDIPTEPNTWRALRCSHIFHKTCIDNWFGQNVHCPVCRADIREFSNIT